MPKDISRKEVLNRIHEYVNPFRITEGKGFRLKDFDPDDKMSFRAPRKTFLS
jgi:hypothetical protein